MAWPEFYDGQNRARSSPDWMWHGPATLGQPIRTITTQLQRLARLFSFVASEKFSYQYGNENGHVQLAGKADEDGHGSAQGGNGRHVAKARGSQGHEHQIS